MPRVRRQLHQPAAGSEYAQDLVLAQQQEEDAWEELYRQNPWMDAVLLEDVELSAFVANDIPHKLGRKLRGYELVRRPALQAACWAELSANQSGVSSGPTLVELDQVVFDHGERFDAANHKYPVPHTGLYYVSWSVHVQSLGDGNRLDAELTVNGAQFEIDRRRNGGSGFMSAGRSLAMKLDKDDAITLKADHDAAGTKTIASGSGTQLVIHAIDELGDGQGELDATQQQKFLRLYSSCDRVVSLRVW